MHILLWKYTWNDLLSDNAFREYMVDRVGKMGFVDVVYDERGKLGIDGTLGDFGSLYVEDKRADYKGLGHFVAYEIQSGQMSVFDSAKPTGARYSGWFNTNEIKSALAHKYKVVVSIGKMHPQISNWDTFCQTWSLAYLMDIPMNHIHVRNAREELFTIIKKIIHSPKFTGYIRANVKVIQGWMDANAQLHGIPPSTVSEFIKFSKTLSLDEFKRL
jgi:hypothetical protein